MIVPACEGCVDVIVYLNDTPLCQTKLFDEMILDNYADSVYYVLL